MKRLIPILLLLVSGVAHSMQWLCVSDKAVHFSFTFSEASQSWEITEIPPNKWIIAVPTAEEVAEYGRNTYWVVRRVEEDALPIWFWCDNAPQGWLQCDDRGERHHFRFNVGSQLYIAMHLAGFYAQSVTSVSPQIEFGECSPI